MERPKIAPLKRRGKIAPPELISASASALLQNPLEAAPQLFTGETLATVDKPAPAPVTETPVIPGAPPTIRRARKLVLPAVPEASAEAVPEAIAVATEAVQLDSEAAPAPTIRIKRRTAPAAEAPTVAIATPSIKRKNPIYSMYRKQEDAEVHTNPYLIETPPPAFVPPTRRGFVKFFDATFAAEGETAANFTLPPKLLGEKDWDACKKLGAASAVEAFKYQQFIREYLRSATPYRGLLVYHGLGSGKTCSAIAAAEALFGTSNKKIIVMTPGSLRTNFQGQISFCGFRHYRLNNHWVFQPLTTSARNFALSNLGLPEKYVDAVARRREDGRRGIWIPQFASETGEPLESNYEGLDSQSQTDIRDQILAILENRIEFINYNGISAEELKRRLCAAGADPDAPGPFDNAVIIVDEIHNLSRLMEGQVHGYMEELTDRGRRRLIAPEPVTPNRWKPRLCGMAKNYKRGFLLYRLIAEARNSKVIGLSGTPLINFPDELGPLVNMIAGYTYGATFAIKERGEAAMAELRRLGAAHPRVDYFEVKPGQVDTQVTLTVFLDGYVKVLDGAGDFIGIREDLDADGRPTADSQKGPVQVATELIAAARTKGLTAKAEPKGIAYPLLPVNPKEFNKYFVNTETLAAENVDVLKKRLYGLISYYKGASEDLMPAIVEDRIIPVRFSEYSLQYYTRKRVQELAEKPSDATGPQAEADPYGDMQDVANMVNPSNYRFNSRAACNFAFPSKIPRPYRSIKKETEAAAAAAEIDDVADMTVTDEAFDINEAEEAAAAEVAREEAAAAPALETVPEAGAGAEAGEAEPTTQGKAILSKAEREAKAAGFVITEEVDRTLRIEPYQIRLRRALEQLRAQRDTYLKMDGPADSNLEKYSPKFATMIRTIDDPEQVPGTSLVYSQFNTAEGLGIFGFALEANGYTHIRLTGGDADPAFTPETEASMRRPGDKRFMFFTGEGSPAQRRIILNIFNGRISQLPRKIQQVMIDAGYTELGNKNGEICKVIGITGAGAEGISLKFVRGVHIMEPYWNDVRLEQVKGRAVRICSHAELPPDDRTVSVFTYVASFLEQDIAEKRIIETLRNMDGGVTSDQHVLTLSENKKKLNSGFLKILKEVAVDCVLNSAENEELVCYQGVAGVPKDIAVQPDLEVDVQKTKIEERGRPAPVTAPSAASMAPPSASAPVVPTPSAAAPETRRRVVTLPDKRQVFLNVDPKDSAVFLGYELTDRTRRPADRTPVARFILNPLTQKYRIEML